MLGDAYLTDPPMPHEILAREFEADVDKAMAENIKKPDTLLNTESFLSVTS